MAKTYSITRETAASNLWISTRTIDRYIKSWKLTYKKIANKVLLAKEEIDELQQDFSALHQESSTEVVSSSWKISAINPSIEKVVEEKIDKFMMIMTEKDRQIEDKNKVIFMLQQRVWELEEKLKTMIALPDYTREKQEALVEKQKLEEKIVDLKAKIKTEKVRSLVAIVICLVLMIVALFILFNSSNPF